MQIQISFGGTNEFIDTLENIGEDKILKGYLWRDF